MLKFKSKSILLLFLVILFSLLLPISKVNAANIEVGDYVLDKDSVIEDDLYISGDNVSINGVVDGDLIITGQNIIVNGTITGDVYIFGITVSVASNIYGNTLIVGSSVTISETVKGNTYIVGMMTDMDGTFNKDVFSMSGTLNLDGTVTDDVRVAGGQVISDASVGGDFLVGSENYTIEESDITGQLIAGGTTQDMDNFIINKSDFLGFNLGMSIVSFLGMYIVGILLILSAPVKTLQIEKKITSSWRDLLKSYAIGLVILFSIPIPLFLLVITLVGAPLALLITGILLFLSIFGTIWVESAIGHKILQLTNRRDNGRFLSLLIGRSISAVLRLIPFINSIYSLSLVVITIGAAFRTKYDAFIMSRNISKKTK